MITASLLIFSLVIEYMYDSIAEKRNKNIVQELFFSYKKIIKDYLEKFYMYISFPIFIYIFMALLISIIGYLIHPFFSFLINLIILFYCLRPNEFLMYLEMTIDKSSNFDDKRFKYIMTYSGDNRENLIINIFHNSSRAIFNIIFFFLLLGPTGSLIYYIIDCYINDNSYKVDAKSKKSFQVILGVLEYLPVQLTVFSLALVSDFEVCMSSYKSIKYDGDLYKYNKSLINKVGSDLIIKSKDNEDYESDQDIIKNLLSRSFLAWMSIIALLIFTGFFI